MKRLGMFMGLALFLIVLTPVAAEDCRFVLGFATLRDLIGHDIVGECLENEHYNHIGDSVQQTTGGLMAWRKADNWTAFTDGYRTWINGPNGLVQRLNTERFEWEADYAPGGTVATPTPVPALQPSPTSITTPTPQPSPTPATNAAALEIIQNLPWVRDGLTSLEMRSLPLLEKLGTNSTQTLRALVDTERDWLPPQHDVDISELEEIVTMSTIDPVAVGQIVAMPFLEDIDVYDGDALRALRDLLRSNPSALSGIVSHPALRDSRTQTDGVVILIQVLKANDPEAAAAIEALPWVRDGIASTEHRSPNPQDASRFEQSLIYTLVRLAGHSRPTFTALLSKPWMRDALTHREYQVLVDFWELALWDKVLAQRMIAMPFFETFEVYDQVIVGTIQELRWIDGSLFGRVMAHPNLANGITDDHVREIFLIVTDLVAPQEAATIRAFSWVQDGISDSDLGGLQVLQHVALSSPQDLRDLIQEAWVQDGISGDEIRAIRRTYDVP